MPLQSGTWKLNLSGSVTPISLTVAPTGVVTGNLGGNPINGFWDEDAQKIILMSFLVLNPPANEFNLMQVFVGYLFTDSVNLLGVSGSVVFTLVGEVQQLQIAISPGTNASAKRSVFGWYAQIGVD